MSEQGKRLQDVLGSPAGQAAQSDMGMKIQILYDVLTPLALLIKERQEALGVGPRTAYLTAAFNSIVKDSDDLAVSGLIMDLLWKQVDHGGS